MRDNVGTVRIYSRLKARGSESPGETGIPRRSSSWPATRVEVVSSAGASLDPTASVCNSTGKSQSGWVDTKPRQVLQRASGKKRENGVLMIAAIPGDVERVRGALRLWGEQ